MRKLIVGTFVSLDGVMQAPGGPEEDNMGGFAFGGWAFPLWDEATGATIGELFAAPFDLLLGRRTYEIFAAYWPYQDDPIAESFNAVTKFVATSSDAPLAWHNSVAIRGDVPAEIGRLKEEDGPNLLVQGSSVLLHALFAHGLVDELRLMTFPLLLGKGKRLFDESSKPGELELVDSRTSTTGVVMSRYVPAGPVRTGSFADQGPSRAERARREKWQREESQA
jgi:dihydrofolate reductase